jgi:hypothetical protein
VAAFTRCEAEFHAISDMGPIRLRPAIRPGLLLVLVAIAVLAAPSSASAGVRLGPDLSVKPCEGQQFCFAAIGCQVAPYTPCSYVNLHSTNAEVPVASPIKGIVTKWRFRAGCCTQAQTEEKKLTLWTFRPGTQDGQFGYSWADRVLEGASFSLPPGNLLVSEPFTELPARLPIAVGERVGIVADNPIDFAVYNPTAGIISTQLSNGYAYGNPMAGTAIAISADVEPDADGDNYGDETQDCAPADPGSHEGNCHQPPASPIVNPPVGGGGGPCVGICGGGGVVIILPPLYYPPRGDGTKVYIPLSCPAAATQPCGGWLIFKEPPPPKKSSVAGGAAKARVFARVKYSVQPGKTKRILVKLSKAGRKLLKRRGKLKVVVTVKPTGGQETSVRRTLKWRGKRAR